MSVFVSWLLVLLVCFQQRKIEARQPSVGRGVDADAVCTDGEEWPPQKKMMESTNEHIFVDGPISKEAAAGE